MRRKTRESSLSDIADSWPVRSFLLKIFFLIAVAYFVIVGLCALASPTPANYCELSAIGSVRAICSAQEVFRERYPEGRYACSLEELSTLGLVNEMLGADESSSYVFSMRVVEVEGRQSFEVTADPRSDLEWRHFYADDSGVIRFERDSPATAQSPTLGQARER